MIRLTASIILLTGPVAASEWQKLDGDTILKALNTRTLHYEKAQTTQTFFADGRTLYENKNSSWGRWLVNSDQYCSVWPPSSAWVCYDLERHKMGLMLRFIGESGSIFNGKYIDLN